MLCDFHLLFDPVDCDVGTWGAWTSCSATCGWGSKNRTRKLQHLNSWFYFQSQGCHLTCQEQWREMRTAQEQDHWACRNTDLQCGLQPPWYVEWNGVKKFPLFCFQWTVMWDHGVHGALALPHAGKGPKKEQGTSQLNFHIIHIDTLLREKKADASNNGTECASSIQSRVVPFPMTETNTCNNVVCPDGQIDLIYQK